MPFLVKKFAKQEVQILVQPPIKNLKQIQEVNEQIIQDTQLAIDEDLDGFLEAGRISKKEYDEQMAQSKVELQNRLRSKEQINGKLERYSQMANEKDELSSFVITEDTKREELKELISILKTKLATTDDLKNKLFLETILQTAESCKALLDEGRTISEKIIPILESEQPYNDQLLASLTQTNKVKPDILNHYLKQLDDIQSFQEKANKDPKLSPQEKQIINTLYESLSKEVKSTLTALTSPPVSGAVASLPEDIIKNHQCVIEKHLATAGEQAAKVAVSSGFKGFINDICTALNCKPVFMAEKGAEIVQNMKNKLSLIRDEDLVQESNLRLQ